MAEDLRGNPDAARGEVAGASPARKRRDNLEDASSEPLYTDAPLPPYIFIVETLLYCCFRFAPGAAAPFLPPGIAAEASSTVIVCLYRHGAGWGLAYSSGGFICVVVDGYPSPDTGEGAFIVGGFFEDPGATLLSRHYAPFAQGRSEVRIQGRQASGRLWSDAGLVLELDNPRAGRAPPQARVLQLLGLTPPAEARIAAAVDAGLPPREAAARLGLAESTVRSSLKVIFDKLGIGRQADLVQIVARLEAR